MQFAICIFHCFKSTPFAAVVSIFVWWRVSRNTFILETTVIGLKKIYYVSMDSTASQSKKDQLIGTEPYAFAISSQTVAMLIFSILVDFKSFHTTDTCSQHPWTLAMEPFWIEELIILFLVIRWSSIFVETKLKNIFPSIFNKATSQKSLTSDGFGGLVFGIHTSDATLLSSSKSSSAQVLL